MGVHVEGVAFFIGLNTWFTLSVLDDVCHGAGLDIVGREVQEGRLRVAEVGHIVDGEGEAELVADTCGLEPEVAVRTQVDGALSLVARFS